MWKDESECRSMNITARLRLWLVESLTVDVAAELAQCNRDIHAMSQTWCDARPANLAVRRSTCGGSSHLLLHMLKLRHNPAVLRSAAECGQTDTP